MMKDTAMRTSVSLAALLSVLFAMPAYALRANLRGDLARLEEMGHYEEVLFSRRSSMDMILAIHVAWSGAPYDPAMDAMFFETRTDRRYWNLVNSQKRPITKLLEKANLSAAQLDRLDERVRVYVEDHMSPDFDEMGNFYFRRKAWVMERMGLFQDASYRRRLTGYYEERVCAPYYLTMAAELKEKGQLALSAAYKAKSEWYLAEAQREFRRSNGDRLLAGLQGGNIRPQMGKPQVISFLRTGLKANQPDARFAAAMALADLGDTSALQAAAEDQDAEIRQMAQSQIAPPPPAGLQPGIVAQYFSSPDQEAPVAQAVLPAAEIGFRGNERFPDKLRSAWERLDVVPANAAGQFLVRFQGKLAIPTAGRYRFYLKTDRGNRATLRIQAKGLNNALVISPRNDKQLLYSVQQDYKGETLTRVDYSLPIELQAGLVDIQIDYKGTEVKGPDGTAGLRLSWSSDDFVMEPVPARAFFHEAK